MEDKVWIKRVALFLAIAHPLEALIARRMAKKRGKDPNLWFFLTLIFGVFSLRKLKKSEPAETEGESE